MPMACGLPAAATPKRKHGPTNCRGPSPTLRAFASPCVRQGQTPPRMRSSVAQIGMSSRVYTDSEIQVLAKAAGAAPAARSEIEQVVALDAVVVIVNKQNPVNTLGLCQIAEIFAGRIRNWRELGGRPGAINLQVRLGPSGTFETFQTLVLKACGVSASRPRLWSPQT